MVSRDLGLLRLFLGLDDHDGLAAGGLLGLLSRGHLLLGLDLLGLLDCLGSTGDGLLGPLLGDRDLTGNLGLFDGLLSGLVGHLDGLLLLDAGSLDSPVLGDLGFLLGLRSSFLSDLATGSGFCDLGRSRLVRSLLRCPGLGRANGDLLSSGDLGLLGQLGFLGLGLGDSTGLGGSGFFLGLLLEQHSLAGLGPLGGFDLLDLAPLLRDQPLLSLVFGEPVLGGIHVLPGDLHLCRLGDEVGLFQVLLDDHGLVAATLGGVDGLVVLVEGLLPHVGDGHRDQLDAELLEVFLDGAADIVADLVLLQVELLEGLLEGGGAHGVGHDRHTGLTNDPFQLLGADSAHGTGRSLHVVGIDLHQHRPLDFCQVLVVGAKSILGDSVDADGHGLGRHPGDLVNPGQLEHTAAL